MVLTIIGIPWARACFTLAQFNLCPFGRELMNRKDLTGKETTYYLLPTSYYYDYYYYYCYHYY